MVLANWNLQYTGFFLLVIVFTSVLLQCSPEGISNKTYREEFIDSLLTEMTLEEKIGQMTLFTGGWIKTGSTIKEDYKDDIKSGLCGNVFNTHGVKLNTELQRLAVDESRLGIPLLFGLDIIHGYKTIFPIPLAEACSWDLDLIEETARLSALESTASGFNWNYNPMVDLCRDPRWGRVAEGSGEDPLLASLIAAAKVRGYQGRDLKDPETIASCVKHFAAYGAIKAGRDYNTVDISDHELREIYLPPFKAAIDAGVASVMTAFNEVNGVPATGSHYLMEEILRNEMGFDGVVVTDFSSINEMVQHGYALNEKHATQQAINVSVDIDMQGRAYYKYLGELVKEGLVDKELINKSVRRILRLKYDLGLFEDPYRYLDTIIETKNVMSKELMDHALESAKRSVVLLKNEKFRGKKILPIPKEELKIAVIGPLAANKIDVMGAWHANGDTSQVVTLLHGLRQKFSDAEILYSRGCGIINADTSEFNEAAQLALSSDIVIMALGEAFWQSGEAASRTNPDLPGVQNQLLKRIAATGKPVVMLVFAGRPLTIDWASKNIPAILYAWHPGTRTGDALSDILSGDYNPSGKLVITFPRNVGQIPVYYSVKNTGRPFVPGNKFTSKYIDSSNDPLYPFGFGLSYTDFHYSEIKLKKNSINYDDTLVATVLIKNTGLYSGKEIVQLYIRDLVGSVTRPIKELKGFKMISLEPKDSTVVEFKLTVDDLKFYNQEQEYVSEPGEFEIFIGANSAIQEKTTFHLNNKVNENN